MRFAIVAMIALAVGLTIAVVFVRTPSGVSAARAAVSTILKDPQSALWGNDTAVFPDVICGTVNAKNAYGGYTGSSLWAYLPDTHEAYIMRNPADIEDAAYRKALMAAMKKCIDHFT